MDLSEYTYNHTATETRLRCPSQRTEPMKAILCQRIPAPEGRKIAQAFLLFYYILAPVR